MSMENIVKAASVNGVRLLLCFCTFNSLYAQDMRVPRKQLPAKPSIENQSLNLISIQSMNIETELLADFLKRGNLVADAGDVQNNLVVDDIIFSDEYDDSEIDPSLYEEENLKQEPVETVQQNNIETVETEPVETENILEVDDVLVTGEKEGSPVEPISTLEGDELTKELGSTLGETLQNQAGVHNATFGPGVGMPVIRGMTGSRIQILQGSMGNYDASSVSPDHAVTIEPLLAKEIKILRGPDTLRYSGNAMGGAIDVKTARIPDWFPENGIEAAYETRYDTNSELFANVFKIDAGKGPLVVHLDGYERSSNNIEIPGNALKEDAVLEQFGNLVEFDNTNGEVLNSDTESTGYSIGSSLVFEKGFIGAAVNIIDNNYGIPPGGIPPHNDDPTITEVTPENLRIDMEQTRWDVHAEIYDVILGIDSISFKVANIDYAHDEVARGVPVTSFNSKATEVRMEMEYSYNENWKGNVGYQWSEQDWTDPDFGATGTESFLIPSDIIKNSFFFIQSADFEKLNIKAGFRRESQLIRSDIESAVVFNSPPAIPIPQKYHHKSNSGSIAAQYNFTEQLSFRMSLTKSERTPAVQELLSLGPHFATRTYEIFNLFLVNETSSNIDLGLAFQNKHLDFAINLFHNDIENYIYLERLSGGLAFYDIEARRPQGNCVQLSGCLLTYGYQQQDANFFGYETELKLRAPKLYNIETEFGIFSDYVRGFFDKDNAAGDVPRLPPRRAGLFMNNSWRSFDFNIRWTHGFAQHRAGLEETKTDSYERLDLGLSFNKLLNLGNEIMFFLKAKNLTDAEIRHSTSFLRNFTPEPGRSLELGLRWSF